MNSDIKRSYEAVRAAVEFCQQHTNYVDSSSRLGALVGKLTETLASLDASAVAAIDGDSRYVDGLRTKSELRAELTEMMRGFAACARVLGKTDLLEKFQPNPAVSHVAFLHAAKAASDAAASITEEIAACELPSDTYERFNRLVNEYEEAIDLQRSGRAGRVGSNANLKALASEGLTLLAQLNGLFQVKFRSEPELLNTWKNVRRRQRNPKRVDKVEEILTPTI